MRAISSTSQRAITPAPGGKPGQVSTGIVCMLPPGAGVIGLRQVDEMALRLPRWRSGTDGTSEPAAGRLLARASAGSVGVHRAYGDRVNRLDRGEQPSLILVVALGERNRLAALIVGQSDHLAARG